MYEDGKALLKSKTFWFNVLTGVVAVATLFGFGSFKPDTKTTEIVAIISAVVNVILRIRTTEPITRL